MSIEETLEILIEAIIRNTTALEKNTAIAEKLNGPSPAPKAVVDPQPVQEKVPTEKKAAPVKKPVVKTEEAQATPSVAYGDIQTLIKNNVQKHRTSITKVLAKYGIKSATELLEEQYKAFFDELKAELPVEIA